MPFPFCSFIFLATENTENTKPSMHADKFPLWKRGRGGFPPHQFPSLRTDTNGCGHLCGRINGRSVTSPPKDRETELPDFTSHFWPRSRRMRTHRPDRPLIFNVLFVFFIPHLLLHPATPSRGLSQELRAEPCEAVDSGLYPVDHRLPLRTDVNTYANTYFVGRPPRFRKAEGQNYLILQAIPDVARGACEQIEHLNTYFSCSFSCTANTESNVECQKS